MNVDVILTVNDACENHLKGKTIIVIDVLRMSTTVVTAFMNNCNEVIPVDSEQEAFELKNSNTILIGEHYCEKILGFDLSNSPTELMHANIANKNIVILTTNGTRAISKATQGENILIGSFLNGTSIARHALSLKKDIVILCAGTRGRLALEDALCAGFILDYLLSSLIECTDIANMVYAAYVQLNNQLSDIIPLSTTGRRLINYGLIHDVYYAINKDSTHIVPYLKDNRIIVQPHS